MLRILFTNICLWSRTGSELVVYDLTRGLRHSGYQPIVYSPRLGELAGEIKAQGVPVFSRLDEIVEKPDIIHGSHYLETLDAFRKFPTVPGLFVCHDRLAWHDEPPQHAMLRLYVAVDHNCRERLLEAPWIGPGQTAVVENAVDTSRFRSRESLPVKPQKALLFSNNACPGTYLEAVQEACELEGIQLDIVGAGVGREVRAPEEILGQYDLVFAKARCALEAMAVGAAVILCDRRGLGPMVKRNELEELRRWNFGMRLLTHPLDPADIILRIREYDAVDAGHVSTYIRREATLQSAVAQYCQLYSRLRTKSRGFPDMIHSARYRPTRKLRCQDQAALRIRLKTRIKRVRPGEEFFVSVRVHRWTLKPVATESPWPTLISYRWYLEAEDTLVQMEGMRSMLLPPPKWGFGRDYNARVVAPDSAGRYRLRVTFVQEDWRWLDEKRPAVFDEMAITVEPKTRAPNSKG